MTTQTKKDSFVIPEHGAINCPGATTDEHKAVECFAPIFTTADPTLMDARDQTRKEDDPYAKGNHPASNLMEIKDNWATPIAELKLDIPEQVRIDLMETIAKDGSNIFIYDENHPYHDSIREFEKISNELIRYYLTNAYNITDADQLNIEARAFGNLQKYGSRTYPHYHHGFDGVLIHYLTAGDEYQLETDRQSKIIPLKKENIIHPILDENSDERSDLKGSGNLILCDPRPAINYPYCNKAIAWNSYSGMTLLHPAYVWHESNEFRGNGIRVTFVINYRVLTMMNQESVKPLASINENKK